MQLDKHIANYYPQNNLQYFMTLVEACKHCKHRLHCKHCKHVIVYPAFYLPFRRLARGLEVCRV